MRINGQRLLDDLYALREITATPGQGVTRFSYTEEDRRVREYLARISREYGFCMETDAVGNMRISPPDSNAATIVGSHIDTVRNGGWLDGIYGVMSGMEMLRTFSDNGVHTDAVLMIYAEEEGSVFGSTMTGSKFLTGKYTAGDLNELKDEQETSLLEHLKNCGYWDEDDFAKAFPMDFTGVDTALELHIEQGPVMDSEGLQIGIVDTVFGMHVLEVEYAGLGNHAGASPMKGRRDPMSAFGEAVTAIERIALDAGNGVVATIGKAAVSPGGSNVIPDTVKFTVDIRSNSNENTEDAVCRIREAVSEIAKARSVACVIRDVADSSAIPFSREVIRSMTALAEENGLAYRVMDSGAVHDTAMLAPYTAAGMIFVPSIDGRSHVPEENTKEDDLICGAQFLLDYVAAAEEQRK